MLQWLSISDAVIFPQNGEFSAFKLFTLSMI